MEKHHAHLIFADSLDVSTLPVLYRTQSADVLHMSNDRFTIDDARELSRLAQQKPFEADLRTVVICTKDIAVEAQNALLKLLEEPPAHTQFYIVIKRTALLLPTLRSRLSTEEDTHHAPSRENDAFASFKRSSYADRLASIAEKTKEKDAAWIEEILRGSEEYTQLHTSSAKGPILRSVVFIRNYLGSKGASSKMLLEELALTLPLK